MNVLQLSIIINIFCCCLRWCEQGYSDKQVWQKAGECGMLGINIPAEHGGIGGSFADACIVIDEL